MTRFKAGQQKDFLQSSGHPTCHKVFTKPVTLTWNGHSPCGWARIQAWLCPFREESDMGNQQPTTNTALQHYQKYWEVRHSPW